LSRFGLHTGANATDVLTPALVSAKWTTLTRYAHDRLRNIVKQAHVHGQQVRFWNTPEPGHRFLCFGSREYARSGARSSTRVSTGSTSDKLGALQDFLE